MTSEEAKKYVGYEYSLLELDNLFCEGNDHDSIFNGDVSDDKIEDLRKDGEAIISYTSDDESEECYNAWVSLIEDNEEPFKIVVKIDSID